MLEIRDLRASAGDSTAASRAIRCDGRRARRWQSQCNFYLHELNDCGSVLSYRGGGPLGILEVTG